MRDLPLAAGIGVYFLSSLGGVSVVKFLNYRYCFTSWHILALVSRSTWMLSAVLNAVLRNREGVVSLVASRRQLCLYGLVASGLALVEVFNSFSMSVLPGSLYMLLKGSDVGWSMTLSYFLLKKNSCYGIAKIVAAALVMLGIGTVLVLDVREGSAYRSHQSGQALLQSAGMSMTSAALLCLVGALLNSLCSVGTEAVLKKTLREEQDRLICLESSSAPPSKLLLSNAYSMYTSLFSFGMLLPLSLLSTRDHNENEENESPSLYDNSTTTCLNAMSSVDDSEYSSTRVYIAIGTCLALLAVSRFLERLCKHFICVHASAVAFSMAQAARRWLGIYIVGLIFREDFANGMIAGSLISGAGFVLHGYDASRATPGECQQREYKKVASDLTVADGSNVSASEEIELAGQFSST